MSYKLCPTGQLLTEISYTDDQEEGFYESEHGKKIWEEYLREKKGKNSIMLVFKN